MWGDLLLRLLSADWRASRSEFWLVLIGGWLSNAVLLLVMFIWTATAFGPLDPTDLLLVAFGLLASWMTGAVCIRRLHDRDKSAWWLLLFLIPVIGPIWLFVEMGLLEGTPGPNRYKTYPGSM